MKYEVDVMVTVVVEIDETIFTKDRMDDFNHSMWNLEYDIEEHAKNIAHLQATGLYDFKDKNSCIEGYGDISTSGISAYVSGDDIHSIDKIE